MSTGDAGGPPPAPLLELRGVAKRYGGVRALEEVDFACHAGSIHAILGENGAGKSTLIKIMAGVVQPDAGEIRLEGRPVRFAGPQAATRAGIVSIFQELSLVPDLSVADNVCLADPPRHRLGLIDRKAQRRRAEALLSRLGCTDIDPDLRVKDLPLSRRQLVEIAKALALRPRLLILDEATSALAAADVERVFALLRALRGQGLALLYISHRMHEIAALADTCSVFRNGRHVATFPQGTRSDQEIVRLMIGRDIAQVYPAKPPPRAVPPCLEVEGLGWHERLQGLGFTVGRGEIVGLGGLDGQGQRELMLALFGVLRGATGSIRLDGRPLAPTSPAAAKAPGCGMALVPEDRKTEGLLLPLGVADNLSLAALPRLARLGVVDGHQERRAVAAMIERLRIKLGDPADPVGTLSGGNQQKVVIGKWLMTHPRLILLCDPTRGIDVGTKQELYALMRDLADQGAAILFYSTDYDELIGCCDRVLILYDGRITAVLEGDAITEQNIVARALNLAAPATGAAT